MSFIKTLPDSPEFKTRFPHLQVSDLRNAQLHLLLCEYFVTVHQQLPVFRTGTPSTPNEYRTPISGPGFHEWAAGLGICFDLSQAGTDRMDFKPPDVSVVAAYLRNREMARFVFPLAYGPQQVTAMMTAIANFYGDILVQRQRQVTLSEILHEAGFQDCSSSFREWAKLLADHGRDGRKANTIFAVVHGRLHRQAFTSLEMPTPLIRRAQSKKGEYIYGGVDVDIDFGDAAPSSPTPEAPEKQGLYFYPKADVLAFNTAMYDGPEATAKTRLAFVEGVVGVLRMFEVLLPQLRTLAEQEDAGRQELEQAEEEYRKAEARLAELRAKHKVSPKAEVTAEFLTSAKAQHSPQYWLQSWGTPGKLVRPSDLVVSDEF